MPDPHAFEMEEEIARIENRSGNRLLFSILGAITLLLFAGIIIVGAKERARLAEEAKRPKTETVNLGSHLGTVGTQAVFEAEGRLSYVQLTSDVEVGDDTRFERPLEYDRAGAPIPVDAGITHWSIADADSLPFIIEPVSNPLIGFNVDDYRQLPLASMTPGDYRSGGPRDWFPLQMEGTNVAVSGTVREVEGAIYLIADSSRVRLQGIEGLSSVDSLELRWAARTNADLSAFGRIGSTPPQRAGAALFVMTVNAVQPVAEPAAEEAS